jgi:hypothetical protein
MQPLIYHDESKTKTFKVRDCENLPEAFRSRRPPTNIRLDATDLGLFL